MKFNLAAGATALLGSKRWQRYEQIPDSDETVEEEARAPQEDAERESDENRALIHSKLWAGQITNHKGITALVVIVVLALAVVWLGNS